VEENHFVIIANPASDTIKAVFTFCTDRALLSHALGQTGLKVPCSEEPRIRFSALRVADLPTTPPTDLDAQTGGRKPFRHHREPSN
jgi:hypothetical protein